MSNNEASKAIPYMSDEELEQVIIRVIKNNPELREHFSDLVK